MKYTIKKNSYLSGDFAQILNNNTNGVKIAFNTYNHLIKTINTKIRNLRKFQVVIIMIILVFLNVLIAVIPIILARQKLQNWIYKIYFKNQIKKKKILSLDFVKYVLNNNHIIYYII